MPDKSQCSNPHPATNSLLPKEVSNLIGKLKLKPVGNPRPMGSKPGRKSAANEKVQAKPLANSAKKNHQLSTNNVRDWGKESAKLHHQATSDTAPHSKMIGQPSVNEQPINDQPTKDHQATDTVKIVTLTTDAVEKMCTFQNGKKVFVLPKEIFGQASSVKVRIVPNSAENGTKVPVTEILVRRDPNGPKNPTEAPKKRKYYPRKRKNDTQDSKSALRQKWTKMGSNLSTKTLPSGPNNIQMEAVPRLNVNGTTCPGTNVSGTNFPGANAPGTSFPGANRINESALGSMPQDANSLFTNSKGANVYGAHLHSSSAQGANVQSANVQSNNVHSANVHSVNVHSSNLYGANSHGENVPGGLSQSANVRIAPHPPGANVQGSNVLNSNVHRANAQNALIQSANVRIAPSTKTSGTNVQGSFVFKSNVHRAPKRKPRSSIGLLRNGADQSKKPFVQVRQSFAEEKYKKMVRPLISKPPNTEVRFAMKPLEKVVPLANGTEELGQDAFLVQNGNYYQLDNEDHARRIIQSAVAVKNENSISTEELLDMASNPGNFAINNAQGEILQKPAKNGFGKSKKMILIKPAVKTEVNSQDSTAPILESLLQNSEALPQSTEPLFQDSETLFQNAEALLQTPESLLQNTEALPLTTSLQNTFSLPEKTEPLLQNTIKMPEIFTTEENKEINQELTSAITKQNFTQMQEVDDEITPNVPTQNFSQMHSKVLLSSNENNFQSQISGSIVRLKGGKVLRVVKSIRNGKLAYQSNTTHLHQSSNAKIVQQPISNQQIQMDNVTATDQSNEMTVQGLPKRNSTSNEKSLPQIAGTAAAQPTNSIVMYPTKEEFVRLYNGKGGSTITGKVAPLTYGKVVLSSTGKIASSSNGKVALSSSNGKVAISSNGKVIFHRSELNMDPATAKKITKTLNLSKEQSTAINVQYFSMLNTKK